MPRWSLKRPIRNVRESVSDYGTEDNRFGNRVRRHPVCGGDDGETHSPSPRQSVRLRWLSGVRWGYVRGVQVQETDSVETRHGASYSLCFCLVMELRRIRRNEKPMQREIVR